MTRVLVLSLLSAALAACAGAEAEPKTGASPSSTTPPPSAVQQCEAFFTRAAACTDTYLPALVDLRIELDKPAGIAAHAQSEGRDAVLAKAQEEWAADSQPAAITANCERAVSSVPPERVEQMRGQVESCTAAADCAAFATCSTQIQRAMMQ